MRRSSIAIVAAFYIHLAGCTGADAIYYSDAPIVEKTITVPPGNRGVVGLTKRLFRKHSWRMVVYEGPTVTQGSVGDNTNLRTSDSFLTRYRLYLEQNQWDICLDGGGAYRYSLSIVDNSTGEEIFASNGNACESVINDALKKELSRFWQ